MCPPGKTSTTASPPSQVIATSTGPREVSTTLVSTPRSCTATTRWGRLGLQLRIALRGDRGVAMAAALFESFGCETTRPASGGGLTYLERMTEDLEDGTHVTLGLRFRTPAHPHVLAALGRALYCFLSLEESVTAILFDAGAATLPMTRAKMAGDKEQAIVDLADRYRSSPIVGREVKPRPRLSPAVGAGMRGPRWVPRSPALQSRRRHVSTCRCWAVWSPRLRPGWRCLRPATSPPARRWS